MTLSRHVPPLPFLTCSRDSLALEGRIDGGNPSSEGKIDRIINKKADGGGTPSS